MSARESYIWLSRRRGVGMRTLNSLLRTFASAEAVYAADRQALTASCRLTRAQADALCDKSLEDARQIMAQCAKKNIQIITIGDSAYPDRLRAIEDPPIVLYVRGQWPDFDAVPGIAAVGTRDATGYGLTVAERLGGALARAGFITVSGMALGNDGAAHRGALRAGGVTVAVLAGGADVCYPPAHRGLMGDILLSGAIVSEYPPGSEPKGTNYHNRNRIISGLCVATVIVEAADRRSGALITARHALDQGRDVYAVPGTIDAPQSAACNGLIERGEAALLASVESLARNYRSLLPRDGGRQVREMPSRQAGHAERAAWKDTGGRDARLRSAEAAPPSGGEQLPPADKAAQEPEAGTAHGLPEGLSDEEKQLVALVQQGASTPEELIERCALPAPRMMSLLTMLEMDGVIRREKGRLTVRR